MGRWQEQAKCRGLTSKRINELFFPETTGPNSQVQAFCNNCPVKIDCLNYGILYKEQGYWGGWSIDQRLSIRDQVFSELRDREVLRSGRLESRDIYDFLPIVIIGPEDLLDDVESLLLNNQRLILELVFPITHTPT